MTISEDKLCTLATWVKTPTPSPLPALRKLKSHGLLGPTTEKVMDSEKAPWKG